MERLRRRPDLETKITIYGSGTNRSARPIWTADELGLEYELVETQELMIDPELRSAHPQGKIPSAKVAGLMLFESIAICEYSVISIQTISCWVKVDPQVGLFTPSGLLSLNRK